MRPNISVPRSAVGPMRTDTGRVERATGETEEEAGRTTHAVGRYDVTLPADATPEPNDVLKVTEAPFDESLEGPSWRFLDVPLDSWQIARSCTAERLT